jgi:phytanoyl-CoA dioxygenase PhyH
MDAAGYLIEDSVFSSDECEQLIEALNRVHSNRSRAGVRNLMSCQAVVNVASEPRLIDFAFRASGRKLWPFKATLFEKAGNANWFVSWHQDTALPLIRFESNDGWGPWSRKAGIDYAHAPAWALSKILAVRIQLDASDSTNGPLRVIEGSQRFGVLSEAEINRVVQSSKEVVCKSDQGGLIAMSPLILHASSKSATNKPRRVLHIEYAESLELAPGVRLAMA